MNEVYAKIKNIKISDVYEISNIGEAGIIVNGMAKLDGIDFKKEIAWYDSFVNSSNSFEYIGGTCVYKFEWIEFVLIDGSKIYL